EFLNRVDDIVLFKPLGEPQIEKIVELQFNELRKRLAERLIAIAPSPAAEATRLTGPPPTSPAAKTPRQRGLQARTAAAGARRVPCRERQAICSSVSRGYAP
ncbi:hypothetical protein, partial [Streptomyces sp. WAC05858]|uniref:hypothetical protein n=1 Tax=Streptomyces sp. WAC05858 TaxID=2487409 RepID=UPI000FB850A0